MTRRTRSHRPGFSLLSLILYTGMVSLTVIVLMRTVTATLIVRQKTGAFTDVQQTVRGAMDRIRLDVMNATSLDGADEGILLLGPSAEFMGYPAGDSSQFHRTGNTIYIKEGSDPPVALTPPSVNVTALTFARLTGTPEGVRVTISAIDNGPSLVHPSFTLTSSFSLRQ